MKFLIELIYVENIKAEAAHAMWLRENVSSSRGRWVREIPIVVHTQLTQWFSSSANRVRDERQTQEPCLNPVILTSLFTARVQSEMCAVKYREESFKSSCLTGAHFKILHKWSLCSLRRLSSSSPHTELVMVSEVCRDNAALEVRLGGSGSEVKGFSSVPTSNDCYRLSQHRGIRDFLHSSPLCSPGWTQKSS